MQKLILVLLISMITAIIVSHKALAGDVRVDVITTVDDIDKTIDEVYENVDPVGAEYQIDRFIEECLGSSGVCDDLDLCDTACVHDLMYYLNQFLAHPKSLAELEAEWDAANAAELEAIEAEAEAEIDQYLDDLREEVKDWVEGEDYISPRIEVKIMSFLFKDRFAVEMAAFAEAEFPNGLGGSGRAVYETRSSMVGGDLTPPNYMLPDGGTGGGAGGGAVDAYLLDKYYDKEVVNYGE